MENESQTKETDTDAKDLKNDVNESSKYNRTLLISFLLFVFYVLVIVASTTDLQLLIPDSKVKLPIINVDLPLFGFYIVAPILIVVLHYNFLFNLLQHRKKLFKWEKEDRDILQLTPFLLNYPVQYKTFNINYYLLKIIAWFTSYFSPIALLLFIQLKFSAYHSLSMTFWHLLIIFTDMFMIFLYWHRINNKELGNYPLRGSYCILELHNPVTGDLYGTL